MNDMLKTKAAVVPHPVEVYRRIARRRSERQPKRLHYFFEQTCDAVPQAPALICGPERLTYAELDARSNQLAHHLLDLGAGAGRILRTFPNRDEVADMVKDSMHGQFEPALHIGRRHGLAKSHSLRG